MRKKIDKLSGFRIELQQKERELVEQAIYMNAGTSVIQSLTQMPPMNILSWLIVLDMLGIIDSEIPTTSDEIINSINTVAKNQKLSKSQRLEGAFKQLSGLNFMEWILGYNVPSVTGV